MNDGFTLLPAKPGTCPRCATAHPQDQPHNNQSLYWQYRFYSQRGRWPTWKDAIEHCAPEVRAAWEKELRKLGAWSEPASEVPDVLPTPQRAIGSVTVVKMERRKPARRAKRKEKRRGA